MSVIDEYLKDVPATQRAELERVRDIIKKTAPDAEEVITYGMPGFKYQKKYLIAFSAFKNHMSVFPGSGAIEDLQDKLEAYKTSKGTLQFTAEHTLPESLIRSLVTNRMKAIDKS